jgi:predicted Fe-Mo cluster-binding NifX family protein
MRIAITASGPTWESATDPRFGRARGFVLIDDGDDAQPLWIANDQNLHAAQGAGIQAAETIHRNRVDVLLTGHVGPKAFRALTAAGIAIHLGIQGSVRDALEDWRAGRLPAAKGADVEGHW